MHLGIDIGGTTVGIGLTDKSGDMLFYEKIDTDKSYDPIVIEAEICRVVEEGLADLGAGKVESIGIGVPGIVSKGRDRIVFCTNLGWENIDFGSVLSGRFGAKVSLYNDATSAAFGEYRLGAIKNCPNSVMLTLGTGIGGGILKDGNIYEGFNGAASEFGHMTIGDNFYTCSCGRVGCLETFASGTAVIAYANKLLLEGGYEPSISSAKEVFNLYKSGDSIGVEAVNRFIRYLGIGIVNIISTIDPEAIVLGGGLALSGDLYIERLRSFVSDWRYFKQVPPPKIYLSNLGESAGVLGAALLGREAISS